MSTVTRFDSRTNQIFSIFGQIEEVVAEAMLAEGKGLKIETNHFPEEGLCPDVWQDKLGRRAKFAIRLTMAELQEFNSRVERLRA